MEQPVADGARQGDGIARARCQIPQGAPQPGFADSSGACDQDVAAMEYPLGVGQLEQGLLVL